MNQKQDQARKAIVYVDTIKTRFNDLDPYGHVNASVYLDYIISARWSYLEKALKVSSTDLIRQGIGFFLANSNINYKRPIKGATEVTVKSWVSSVEGTFLHVDFIIEGSAGETFSDGVLKFAVMDLKKGKMQEWPKEAENLLWEAK